MLLAISDKKNNTDIDTGRSRILECGDTGGAPKERASVKSTVTGYLKSKCSSKLVAQSITISKYN